MWKMLSKRANVLQTTLYSISQLRSNKESPFVCKKKTEFKSAYPLEPYYATDIHVKLLLSW